MHYDEWLVENFTSSFLVLSYFQLLCDFCQKFYKEIKIFKTDFQTFFKVVLCHKFYVLAKVDSKMAVRIVSKILQKNVYFVCLVFKGALSSLKQFLETERPLKMVKNAAYFTSNALFVRKIFKFLS